MYNDLIAILSGVLNIYGTVKTVMTVINIDFKDLSLGGTLNKIAHPEIDIFTNRKNALNGIAIIIIGFLLGLVEKYYVFNLKSFIITCLVTIVLIGVLRIYYFMQYIFLIREFDKYLLRNGKTSVIDKLEDSEMIRNVWIPIKFNVNKYIKRL